MTIPTITCVSQWLLFARPMKAILVNKRPVVAVLLLSVACGSEDTAVVSREGSSAYVAEDADGTDPERGHAYLLMHTVESPEGRSNYVQVTNTLCDWRTR